MWPEQTARDLWRLVSPRGRRSRAEAGIAAQSSPRRSSSSSAHARIGDTTSPCLRLPHGPTESASLRQHQTCRAVGSRRTSCQGA